MSEQTESGPVGSGKTSLEPTDDVEIGEASLQTARALSLRARALTVNLDFDADIHGFGSALESLAADEPQT
ncbi:MAG: hypothetical protein AAFY56_07550 [Pseudomonadota bacterium]